MTVSQHMLHKCVVHFDDGAQSGVSIFPLFDDTGRTHSLCVIDSKSSRIALVEWRSELFRIGFLGRKHVALRWRGLRDTKATAAQRIGKLWHFDPWWELIEERYSGHAAVPPIRGTNIPGYDKDLKQVHFEADLGRLCSTDVLANAHRARSKKNRVV
jgi:hypothetical protein